MDSELKQKLRSLCWRNGWSYGIFWCFDQRKSMLLTVEDAYCEEQMQAVVDNMLLQVHTLGKGIIGQAALTASHLWVFSDATHNMFQDESEFHHQFMSGIKTILVIPVGTRGVLQFGSTRMVPESPEILCQTKRLFQDMDTFSKLTKSETLPSSMEFESYDLNELFSTVLRSESFKNGSLDQVLGHTMNIIPVCDVPEEEFKEDNFMTDLRNPNLVDDLSHMVFQSEDQSVVTTIKDDFSKSLHECSSASPMLPGADHQERSMTFENSDKDLFEALRIGFIEQNNDHNASQPEASEVQKGLFSELGLDELLTSFSSNSSSVTNCWFEDHFPSTKRRKIESSSASSSCFSGRMNANTLFEKEFLPRSGVSLWNDGGYSAGFEKMKLSSSRKLKETVKATKKRAKPGEGTRPRPKDRQLIQERIKELRGIIPRGAKCSIDALLDLTVKHMLFLQSVAKHADELKQFHKPKLIGNQNGPSPRQNVGEVNGATWAYEMGDQTMFCPIIVEDLSPQGHMLIEMLCDDRGCFLEMVDLIKGLGVRILKGAMETRESKIWAHFIVEANRCVKRLEIFWSLVEVLHQTEASGIHSANKTGNLCFRFLSV